MEGTLNFEGKKYISAKNAAKKFGYTSDYVGQLCRGEKIKSRLVGRQWYLLESEISSYKKNHVAPGRPAKKALPTQTKTSKGNKASKENIFIKNEKEVPPKIEVPKEAPKHNSFRQISRQYEIDTKKVLYIKDDSELFPILKKPLDLEYIKRHAFDRLDKTNSRPHKATRFDKIAVASSLGTLFLCIATFGAFEGSGFINRLKTESNGSVFREVSILYSPLFRNVESSVAKISEKTGVSGSQLALSVASDSNTKVVFDFVRNIGDKIFGRFFGRETIIVDSGVESNTVKTIVIKETSFPSATPVAQNTGSAQAKTVYLPSFDKTYIDLLVEQKFASLKEYFLTSPVAPNVNRYYVSRQNDEIIGNVGSIAANLEERIDAAIANIDLQDLSISTLSVSGTSVFSGNVSLNGSTTATSLSATDWLSVGTTTSHATLTVDGAFYLAQVTPPGDTSNRLYNDGGDLYWNGSILAGSGVGNWSTDGTSVWRAGGNVGVGTTSPFAKFSVGSTAGQAQFVIGSSTATQFIVDRNGNVGVGVLSPTQLLDVAGSVQSSGSFFSGNGIGISPTQTTMYSSYNFGWNANATRAGSPDVNLSRGGVSKLYVGNGTQGDFTGTLVAGNVGVGTSSPTRKFEVVSNGANVAISDDAGDSSGYIGTVSNHHFKLISNSATRLFIHKDSGNIGIGTTSPQSLVTIAGGSSAAQLRLDSTAAVAEGFLLYRSGVEKAQFGISAGTNNGITGSAFNDLIIRSTGNMLFSAAPLTQHMIITTGGNIGVSSSTPWGLLSVNANGLSSGAPQFVVGSSTATNFIVANNGNVGVGTTTPQSKLHVSSGSILLDYANSLSWYNSGGVLRNVLTFNNSTTLAAADGDVIFSTTGSEKMRITSGGNVGIGTTSPQSLLHLYSGGANTNLDIDSTSNSLTRYKVNNSVRARIGSVGGLTVIDNVLNSNYIAFQSNSVTQMVMDTSGRLGIGTTSPYAKLSVVGDASITGDVRVAGLTATGTVTFSGIVGSDQCLQVDANGVVGGTGLPCGSGGGGSGGGTWATTTSQVANRFVNYSLNSTDLVAIGSNSTTTAEFWFDPNTSTSYLAGNVGIGVSNPSAKLDVNGSVYVRTGSIYSDSFSSYTGGSITHNVPASQYARFVLGDSSSSFQIHNASSVALLKMEANGRMGLGSTTPWAQLSVHRNTSDTSYSPLFAVASSTASGTTTNFIVANNGNVGVGTFNPRGVLDINIGGSGIVYIGTAGSDNNVTNIDSIGQARFYQKNGSGVLTNFIQTAGSSYINGGNFGVGSTTPWGLLSVNANGLSSGAPQFVVGSSTATNFIVANNGNVGVGTTTPSQLLTVGNNNQFTVNSSGAVTTYGGLSLVGSNITMNGNIINTVNSLRYTSGGGLGLNNLTHTVPISTGSANVYVTPTYNQTAATGVVNTDFLINRTETSLGTTPGLQLLFDAQVNGVSKFVINNSGNIGIGTTSPFAKLSVVGDAFITSNLTAANITATGTLTLGTTTAGTLRITSNGLVWADTTGGTAASSTLLSDLNTWSARQNFNGNASTTGLTVTGSTYLATTGGNVGVGTTAPLLPLHIESNNSAAGVMRIRNSSASGWSSALFYNSAGIQTGSFGWGNSSASVFADQAFFQAVGVPFVISTSGGGGSAVYVESNNGRVGIATTSPWGLLSVNANGLSSGAPQFVVGSSTATNFIVTNGGNVGIGTTTPRANLEVNGGVIIGNPTFSPSYYTIGQNLAVVNGTLQTGTGQATGLFYTNNNGGAISLDTGVLGAGTLSIGRTNYLASGDYTMAALGNLQFSVASGKSFNFNTGNVGIGTTNPQFNLDVNSGIRALGTNSPTSGVGTELHYVSGEGYITVLDRSTSTYKPLNVEGSQLQFKVSGSEKMRLTSTGNFGIGSTTPWGLLSVNANGLSSGAPQFVVGSSTATNFIVANGGNVGVGTVSPGAKLSVEGSSGTLAEFGTAGSVRVSYDRTENRFRFSGANGQITTPDGHLLLNPTSNNVGIGTTTPGTKLDVYGSAKVGLTTHSSTVYESLLVGERGDLTDFASIKMAPNSTASRGWGINVFDDGTSNQFFSIADDTTDQERLRITHAGNVGIGTTSPNARLSLGANTGEILHLYDAGTNDRYGFGIQANLLQVYVPDSNKRIGLGYGVSGSFTETLTIKGSNVGIGTTSPFAKLSVVGDAFITSNLTASNITATGTLSLGTTTAGTLRVTSSGLVWSDTTGGTAASSTLLSDLNTWSARQDFNGNASTTGLTVTGSTYLATAGGNVGLGTVAPQAKLSLGADVTAQKMLLYDSGNVRYGMGIATSELRIFAPSGGNHISFGSVSSADGSTWSEKMRIDNANGNVGVGTTSPWAQLSVHRNTSDTSYSPLFAVASSTASATTTAFIVTNNGNVGVGTASPTQKLSVIGGGIALNTANTVLTDPGDTSMRITNTYGYIDLGPKNGAGAHIYTDLATFYMNKSLTLSTGVLTSYTATDLTLQTAGTTRLTVSNTTGNIGIGTTTPTNKLSIFEQTTDSYPTLGVNSGQLGVFSGNSGVGKYGILAGVLSSTGNGYIQVQRVDGSATAYDLSLQPSGGKVGIASTTPWGLLSVNANGLSSGAPQFVVGSSTATNFIVANNGNVGVGTATPAAKLDVNGRIVQRGGALSNMNNYFTTNGDLSANTSQLNPGMVVYNDNAGGVFGMDLGYSNSTYRTRMFAGSGYDIALSNVISGSPSAQSSFVDRLVVKGSNGFIGISTSTPLYNLTVASTTGPQFALSAGAGIAQWTMRNAGGNLYFATTTVAGTATTSTSALSILNSGNVGIGTSNPGFPLHVNGNAMIGSTVPTYIPASPLNLVNSAGGSMKVQMNLVNTGGGAGAGSAIDFYTYDLSGGTNPGMRIASYDNNYSADFTILTKVPGAAGNSLSERFRITNTGSVGIGTSSPTNVLGVVGNIDTTGSYRINNTIRMLASSNYTEIHDGAGNGRLHLGNATDPTNYYSNNTHVFRNGAADTEYMKINSTGVGIGTTSPANLLHVAGAAPTLKIDRLSGTADQQVVFAQANVWQGAIGIAGNTNGIVNGTVSGDMGVQVLAGKKILFSTDNGGTSALAINDGKIGVGTTTPWGLLSVNANGLSSGAPQFVVGSSTATNFIVANNGYVGIGTAAPTTPLHIQTPGATGAVLSLTSLGSGASAIRHAKNGSTLFVVGPTGSSDDYIIYNDGFAANSFRIKSSDGSVLLAEAGGYVGVGTTTPNATFALQGAAGVNILTVASSTSGNILTISSWGGFVQNIASTTAVDIQNGSGASVFTVDTTGTTANSGIDITAGASQTGNLINLFSSGGSYLSGFTASGAMLMNVSSTTAIDIQNGSNVSVFAVDTTNKWIKIATSSSPTFTTDGQFTIGNSGTAASGGRIWIRSGATTFRFQSDNNTADYSEFFYQFENSEAGDVLSLATSEYIEENSNASTTLPKDTGVVRKSAGAYEERILGVYTERGTSFNNPNDDRQNNQNFANVGLLGHVLTKVTNENGEIRTGDYITSSDKFPGYGMKATKSGQIIGVALEDFGNATTTEEVVEGETYELSKVMVMVSPRYQVIKETVLVDSSTGGALLGEEIQDQTPLVLHNQNDSGPIMQLQAAGQTRLIAANNGSLKLFSQIANPNEVAFEISNNDSSVFSITSGGNVKVAGTIFIESDSFAGSIATNDMGLAEIDFANNLGTGKPVVQLTPEGDIPTIAQVASWKKDLAGNYIGLVIRAFGTEGQAVSANVHYAIFGKREGYNTLNGLPILTNTSGTNTQNDDDTATTTEEVATTTPETTDSETTTPEPNNGDTEGDGQTNPSQEPEVVLIDEEELEVVASTTPTDGGSASTTNSGN